MPERPQPYPLLQLLFPVVSEGFYGRPGELYSPAAASGLRTLDPHYTGFKVYVFPPERQQLALPEPRVYRDDVEGFKPVSGFSGRFEKHAGLFGGEGGDILLRDFRWVYGFGGITRDEALPERLFQSPMQNHVEVLNGTGRKPRIQLGPVETLEVCWGEIRELHCFTESCSQVSKYWPTVSFFVSRSKAPLACSRFIWSIQANASVRFFLVVLKRLVPNKP